MLTFEPVYPKHRLLPAFPHPELPLRAVPYSWASAVVNGLILAELE